MLFEENAMTSDNTNSPIKPESHQSNANLSWAQEVMQTEEMNKNLKDIEDVPIIKTEEIENDFKSDTSSLSIKQEQSSERIDISLDFIGSENEKKFDRLIKDEKLKIPFKRSHSTSRSRSNSTNNENEIYDSKATHKTEKRKCFENSAGSSHSSSSKNSKKIEENTIILQRRQKQIDYGKNTVAYDRYRELVPRYERSRDHPHTPDKYGKYSRRAFDGLIKIWRKQLHYYDPPEENSKVESELSSSSESSDIE